MLKSALWLSLVLLLSATRIQAQTIQLTNGDHLSGRWLQVEGGTIQIDSPTLGKIGVPLAKVASFAIVQPLVVVLKNGQTLPGSQARFGAGTWHIQSPGASRDVASADVASIVTAADYNLKVVENGAKPWRGWHGAIAFGYSLQTGTQNAHSVGLTVGATRHQPDLAGLLERWRTAYSLDMLFATATNSANQKVSSNTLSTALRQDYLFTPHNFLFVLGQLDHLQPQNLYLRQTYGGGYGRDLLTHPRLLLSALAGVTFVNEKFTGVSAQQYTEALVGERATIHLTSAAQVDHAFNFYPNLTNRGQYRFDTTTSLGFPLKSRLSVNLAFTDFYINQIPAGAASPVTVVGPGGTLTTLTPTVKNNNVALTIGLGLHF